MGLTEAELNRATLARQLLLERSALGVTDAVRQVVALQAQQPASPYLALWNRLAGFDPAALDAAYAAHQVVRATLMRITMHAVHVADHQAFREAMEPTLRAARLGDPRFTSSGLTPADADVLMSDLLDFAGQPRTAAECGAWIEQRVGTPFPPVAWRGLGDELEQLAGPGGATLYDVPGGARPAGDFPAPPRLLGMWDSILLAYAATTTGGPSCRRPRSGCSPVDTRSGYARVLD